ncbi:uncharacterized protein si:ch211-1a19.3 [Mugil cephalus]|uniref:uncharacterized protein si:ch211-1a19.3 n=1 Tax=Mugil cephalus TaxID=48193 RepID=UPI001FB58FB4|nr:uncharacterized protein si:ch211-1a19.3 [Mugil cephalus]
MGSSKSSQRAWHMVMALLALWSIVSLVVIVVWATSPDLKGVSQCRASLQEEIQKGVGAKVVWEKNKEALEQMVQEAREENDRQKEQILVLMGQLNATNATLQDCLQDKVVLHSNITSLQDDIEQLQAKEANLTALLSLREDRIDILEQNLTQATHLTDSCNSLKAAAESHMLAAQAETKACKSSQQFLQKQLQKCKDVEAADAPKQNQESSPSSPPSNHAAAVAAAPLLTLLVCNALHLIT